MQNVIFIIFFPGNRDLLSVHRMWNSLISHCQRLGCLVDEKTWLTDGSAHAPI